MYISEIYIYIFLCFIIYFLLNRINLLWKFWSWQGWGKNWVDLDLQSLYNSLPMDSLYRTTVQRETVHLTRTLCKQTCKVDKVFQFSTRTCVLFGLLVQQLIWSLLGVWLHTSFFRLQSAQWQIKCWSCRCPTLSLSHCQFVPLSVCPTLSLSHS